MLLRMRIVLALMLAYLALDVTYRLSSTDPAGFGVIETILHRLHGR
jgi:hypothetical protein